MNHVGELLAGLVGDKPPAPLHFGLGRSAGKASRQTAQGFGGRKMPIQRIADGHIFRGRGEGPERLRADGQGKRELGIALSRAELRDEVGPGGAGLAQPRQGGTAGPALSATGADGGPGGSRSPPRG